MPDQKRQSLGRWVDVDCVEDNSSFPKGWISVFQCTRLGSLLQKRKKKGGKLRAWKRWLAPFFCTYLFIVIYYDSSAETLLWDQIQGGAQIAARFSSKSYKSCIALKILAQRLHVPKRLLMGCVSSFGDSSSNAFFAHLIPSGTAIIQAHSILQGWEKGTEQRRSQGVQNLPCNWNIKWLFCFWRFQHACLLVIQHV